jgi:hypothetical protein
MTAPWAIAGSGLQTIADNPPRVAEQLAARQYTGDRATCALALPTHSNRQHRSAPEMFRGARSSPPR